METSVKTGFAQIFSCCPKNLSCPNFGGAAAPLAPPARTPMILPHDLCKCWEKTTTTPRNRVTSFIIVDSLFSIAAANFLLEQYLHAGILF